MELESFTLIVLRRPPDAPRLSEAELESLQERHLAHLAALKERGALLVAGPFSDQADESWRGLCIYGVGLDEATRLAEEDPSVRAGRLAVEPLTWWVQRGALPLRRPT
jgi:uncharacterized protein